jgi:chitodextrinase
VNGSSSTLQVWLDGAPVGNLPTTVDLGLAGPVAQFQIGDTAQPNGNDILYDDAAFGTARLGPGADSTAPTVPGGLAATPSSFSVALTWNASTDDVGIGGYDVYRGGTLVASLGNVTSYTDTNVLASTSYSYTVRARDISGNPSPQSAALPVTTLASAAPVFADGFESGDLSAWSTNAGLTIEGSTVHGGANAAEGNATAAGPYAKKTLPSTYADGYARVWFQVVNQTSQVNLLRMRDAADASVGFAYIGTTGRLGFHNDAFGPNVLSATSPGPGWHALELHILTGGASGMVELWLDNVPITDLSGATTTSAAPVGRFQIGETQTTGQIYDVLFDDVAVDTVQLP